MEEIVRPGKLVRAGVGVEGEVEEFVLQILFGRASDEGRAARGGRDDGQQDQFGDGGAGDVDALGV